MRASKAWALVLVLLAGCTFFASEPPCRSDDNCAGGARCDAETERCVRPDAGPADDAAGAGEA